MSPDLKTYFISRPPSTDDLRTSLATVVDDGLLRRHLQSIIKEPDPAGTPITAYRHPNGFTKIRVAGVTGQWALRLHAWDPKSTISSDIHNHRWNFASRILCGKLAERTFHLSELGDGDWHLLDCHKNADNTYFYQDRGRCAIRESAAHTYCTGDSYLLKYSVLHDAAPGDSSPLVTVVLQGADIRASTTVVSAAGSEPPQETFTDRVTGHELEDALWQVIEHLPA